MKARCQREGSKINNKWEKFAKGKKNNINIKQLQTGINAKFKK